MKDLSVEIAEFENIISDFNHLLHFYDIEEGDEFIFEINLGLASKYNKFILKWFIRKVIPGSIVTINKEIRSHKLIIKCNDWYGFETNELGKILKPNCNYKEINNEISLWLKKQIIEYFKLEEMIGRIASKIRFSSIIGTDIKDLKELISEYAPEFKGRFQIRK